VPRHLGGLAGCTRVCLCEASISHSWPHKRFGHQIDIGFDPWVAKAVEGVKELASERRGEDRPWLRNGCVTLKVDVRPGNWHSF
jgi:hypothetical protein